MSRKQNTVVFAMMVGVLLIAGCGGEKASTSEKAGEEAASQASAEPTAAKECKVEILNWNPKEIMVGQQFNVQKSGDSAYWVKVTPESQGFEANVDGQPVKLTYGSGLVTFLHQGPLVTAAEGKDKIRVDFTCAGTPVANIEIQLKR